MAHNTIHVNNVIWSVEPKTARLRGAREDPKSAKTVDLARYNQVDAALRQELLDDLMEAIAKRIDTSGTEFDSVYNDMRLLVNQHHNAYTEDVVDALAEAVDTLAAENEAQSEQLRAHERAARKIRDELDMRDAANAQIESTLFPHGGH
jgi:hypothetical protein